MIQVIEQTDNQKLKMYMKVSKKKLIKMLIQANEMLHGFYPIHMSTKVNDKQFNYDFSHECKCKDSPGETWCCNLCGLPTNKHSENIVGTDGYDVIGNHYSSSMPNKKDNHFELFKEYLKRHYNPQI